MSAPLQHSMLPPNFDPAAVKLKAAPKRVSSPQPPPSTKLAPTTVKAAAAHFATLQVPGETPLRSHAKGPVKDATGGRVDAVANQAGLKPPAKRASTGGIAPSTRPASVKSSPSFSAGAPPVAAAGVGVSIPVIEVPLTTSSGEVFEIPEKKRSASATNLSEIAASARARADVQQFLAAWPNIEQILQNKLNSPTYPLSPEERIALLTYCIEKGKTEVQKIQETGGCLIVVLGNTGAGKSTFVNAMCERTMERIDPEDLGIKSPHSEIVITKDEITPIGHNPKKSMTFMPCLAIHRDTKFIDAPGFLDKRGSEINTANAVNVRAALTCASELKIVILINYNSLLADRARGLTEMIKICCDLFGSKEELVRHRNSLMLGISQVPLDYNPRRKVKTLANLREFLTEPPLSDDFENTTIRSLAERIFIYDPLDDLEHLKYSGALTKAQVMEKIAALPTIKDPGAIFKTVLTSEDLAGLLDICSLIKKKIQIILDKQNKVEDDYTFIAAYLTSLQNLEIIEHPKVYEFIADARNVITRHFHQQASRFQQCVADESFRLAEESERILNILKAGITHFDEEIKATIDLDAFEEQYLFLLKKKKAKTTAKELADLDQRCKKACNLQKFEEALTLLNQIKEKALTFTRDFSDTGVELLTQVEEVESFYNRAHQQYQSEIERQKREKLEREALTKQQKELQVKLENEEKARRKAEKARKAAEEEAERTIEELRKKAEEDARKAALKAKKKAEQEALQKAFDDAEREAARRERERERERIEIQRKAERDAQRREEQRQTRRMELRNQIIGQGVIQEFPLFLVVSHYGYPQQLPILWRDPYGIVVPSPDGGYARLIPNQGGAVRVNLTPMGPVDLPE